MTLQIDNIQRSNLQQRGTKFNWNGFHRALVIDCEDKKLLGRVKVRIPDLMPEQGDDFTKDWDKNGIWAHSGNCHLGGRNIQDTMGSRAEFEDAWYQGSCLIPPAGSWVWVFFENGEPNHPYYFGSLEAGQRKVLPENQEGSEWWKKWTLIKTNAGRCIIISDDEDDARIEITGKKRLMTNPPDGDQASVFTIDDNQTVILLDERPGKGKLMLKDYRGNYITMHIDDESQDQLHIYFKDDIHIETLKNLYIKTGEDMHVDVGANYKLTASSKIDTKAGGAHKEKAKSFNRFALFGDVRTALSNIKDTAGGKVSHCAGGNVECGCGGSMKMNGSTVDILGDAVLNLQGGATTNVSSGGIVNVNGAITNVQCGAGSASSTFPLKIASIAKSADEADPIGDRDQESNPMLALDPIIPEEDMDPPPPIDVPVIEGDPYGITFGGYPRQNEPIITKAPKVESIVPTVPSSSPTSAPIVRQAGVGHMYTMQLKQEYREKIIPLIDKSCGTFTGFSIFKDVTTDTLYHGETDSDYYDNGVTATYDYNYNLVTGWNQDWLDNLEAFCLQAKAYNITVIASLFDFKYSPNDPLLNTVSDAYKYTTMNWGDSTHGLFIQQVVQRLKKCNYIINIGQEYYSSELPDNGWFRKLIMYLLNSCGVSSTKLGLTAGPDVNLYDKNPYCEYKVYTGSIVPADDEINNQEYIDGQWGGTGRVAVYNDQGVLIDGYLKYLYDCSSKSIPCMSTWKMSEFESAIPIGTNSANVMNYIFAPRQREAMRKVLCSSSANTGFIDFT